MSAQLVSKTPFTKEEIEGLYAPFDLKDHEIREGYSNSAKTRIRWFVYIRREAIQTRLDMLFLGAASYGFCNPMAPYTFGDKHVSCAMYMEIRGIRREFNGSTTGKDENGEKGAATDALKRVASLWGMGLYLQSSPDLYTGSYRNNDGIDWAKKDAMELQAKKEFAAWYNETFPVQKKASA